jgi:15-cis-phytoene synthase
MQMHSLEVPAQSALDQQACRELLRTGSRSFYAASFLLPSRVRDPACALYAFCRIADDAIDVSQGDEGALTDLHDRITNAYAGRPRSLPYDRAFAATVAKFSIPRALPDALIEGFAWDVSGRRYDSLDDLLAYAARVAGTVGAMMCLLMGRRDRETLARAADLGMAMQLTNIARDVGEDARAGRIYLPLQWCRAEGIDAEAWLQEPQFSPAIGRVVSRLLNAAAVLYMRADVGIAALPADCRRGIRAARYLYAEIGNQVARQSLDSISVRAVVSPGRKVGVLSRAVVPARPAQAAFAGRFTDASCFLIDAVAAAPMSGEFATRGLDRLRWWDLRGQALHVIELFDRLERRQQATARTASSVFESYSSVAQSS